MQRYVVPALDHLSWSPLSGATALLAEQDGTCALCERTTADKTGRPLHVDHDHETGAIRGLLCSDHNTGLGKLGDNAAGLQAALDYLDRC